MLYPMQIKCACKRHIEAEAFMQIEVFDIHVCGSKINISLVLVPASPVLFCVLSQHVFLMSLFGATGKASFHLLVGRVSQVENPC